MKQLTSRKMFLALALGMLAVLVLASPAMAARSWCAKDPIVLLNGTPVQMWIAIDEQYVPYVNGPIDVKVYTPGSVEREVVFLDEGFNGYGETVTWGTIDYATVASDGSFNARVNAIVPVDKQALKKHTKQRNIPLQLTIVYEDGTNQVIEMTNDGTKIDFKVLGKKKGPTNTSSS